MEIVNFDKEFVERTRTIVEAQCNDESEYNVTLLLNCLMGLVSLPTERTQQDDTSFMAECVDKLNCMGVVKQSKNDEKTFRTVKNALSHMYIEPKNENGYVETVVLQDRYNRNAPAHTELHFKISELKEFALYVADKHLERFSSKDGGRERRKDG